CARSFDYDGAWFAYW
nr:immunoglobulin heavy chain junction region [Mus musculus]MBK4196858.1 immunoglobulin heavy chain junction region [Mus musculus]MBK4196862.1 immunoglobulin heavy chain junction region [Mus musculus]